METVEPDNIVVICDAGPLIHLDELGSLHLLSDFSRVLVPATVWHEVEHHRPSALSTSGVVLERIAVATISPVVADLVQALTLHAGEKEALQLATERTNSLLLTDDTAARLAAQNLHITAHGTIGLLIRAVRRSQYSKDEVLQILQSLPNRSTLHIKRSLLESVIRQVRDHQSV